MTGPDEEIPQMQWAISAIMRANYLIYFCIAIVLVLLAFASFYDVALEFLQAFEGGFVTTNGILQVLHALLVTIIIIEILETVTAYFRTNQLQVRPILIAGLTAMVRKVLVYGLEPTDLIDVVGTVAVIAVLTAAMCRAVGIPARVVSGLIYAENLAGQKNVFGGHAWAEAWVGGVWIGLDATRSPQGYGPGHITLSRGNGNPADFLNLVNVLGGFRIEKVTIQPLPPAAEKTNGSGSGKKS